MKQNDAISIAKGLGIILMVIGHVGCPERMFYFIYLFHMPLFFWLSGYCFKDKYMDDKKTFIWHRIKGLYVPFIKYNLLFIALHNVLYSLKFFNSSYSWQEILTKTLHSLFMGNTEFYLEPFWFLRYLLLSALAFLLLRTLFRHHPNVIRYVFWVIPLLAIPCNYYHFNHIISCTMLLSFFFYCAGYAFKNIKITNNIYIVILFFIIVAIASTFNHSDFIHMKTIEIIPYCIFALVGIYATLSFSSIISKRKTFITKCLVYIGNNTLYILTWHIFAFDIFSLFYLKVIAQRPFNSIEEEYLFLNLGGIYIICYVLLGITIPLLIKVLFNYKNIRHWLHIN